MPINCPQIPTSRKKKKFNDKELTNIRRRRLNYEWELSKAAQIPRNKAAQVAAEQARTVILNRWEALTADLVSLAPHQLPKLQDFLVTQFGIKARALGLDPSLKYTKAGEVRYSLLEAKRVIEGMVNDAGRLQSLPHIRNFTKTFNKLGNNLRIKPSDLSALIDDTLTIGQIPRTQSTHVHYRINNVRRTSLFDVIQQKRYTAYRERMSNAGFTPAQTDRLIELAARVSSAFDNTRAVATAVGVQVGDLDNIGYFSRIVTKDFELRLKDLSVENLLEEIKLGTTDLSTIFNRSRSTNHFIPEDLAFVSELLKVPSQDIYQMLNDPLEWRQFLHDNLTTEQLDTLVDSGIMSKLPMSSREVFEYFVRQYDLPYKGLDEMFITDPTQVLSTYTISLQNSAGNSAMLKRMVDGDAFAQGWAVRKELVDQNKDLYSNFVPLGKSFDKWAKQANVGIDRLAQMMGVDPVLFTKLSDVYVHPIVADQWSSLMQVSMSPALMGNLASTLNYVSRWFNKRILTNVEYVTRSAMQSTLGSIAAGGNILSMPMAFRDVFRFMANGLDSLDNTRPFRTIDGVSYTKRELFQLLVTKRGQGVVPGVSNMRMDVLHSDFMRAFTETPTNVRRAMQHLIDYTMAHGDPVNGRKIPMTERIGRFSRKSADIINGLMDDVFSNFAIVAYMTDIAGKWNTVQSITNSAGNSAFRDLSQILTSFQYKRFNTVEDIFRHVDEYFVDGFDVGKTTSFVANYVRPFAVWAMANPPMQLRHLMRNPHLYLGYHRVRSFLNEPLVEDKNFTEDTVASWQLEEGMMHITYDDDGNPVVLFPNNIDPIGDAFAWANQTQTKFRQLALDQSVGTQTDLRKKARGELFDDFVVGLFGSTHLPWKLTIETVTGLDTFTGSRFTNQTDADELPTFLGRRWAPRVLNVLEKFPMLRMLNQANPGNIFGTPDIRDINGNVIQLGDLSVFGERRLDSDREKYDYTSQNFGLSVLRMAGLNVRTIDYSRNARYTLSDIDKTIRDLSRSIDSNTQDIQTQSIEELNVSSSERQRRTQEIKEQINMLGQLMIDRARVTMWMNQNNVLSNDALRELDTLNIQVRQLPYPHQEELDRILGQVMEYHMRLSPEERQDLQLPESLQP